MDTNSCTGPRLYELVYSRPIVKCERQTAQLNRQATLAEKCLILTYSQVSVAKYT